MTNLSKNGNRQTALDLGDQFDETAYRAELIAAGIEPAAAADIAAKTAQTDAQERRRDPHTANACGQGGQNDCYQCHSSLRPSLLG